MLKKLVTAIAPGVLSVLLMAGCAGAPAAEPAKSSPAAVSTPKPDKAQAASLSAELAKVNPAFADGRSVLNAIAVCHGALAGRSDEAQVRYTQQRFASRDVKAMSVDDAKRIIEVINANGFCKAES